MREQPWHTGRLATFGQSYLGFTQWSAAAPLSAQDPSLAPDALCVITSAPPDLGAVMSQGGAFSLHLALGWTRSMDLMARGGLALAKFALPALDGRLRKALRSLPLSATGPRCGRHHVDGVD